MYKDQVNTPIDPSSLTDAELIRFAEELLHDSILGMTRKFQEELLKRFTKRII